MSPGCTVNFYPLLKGGSYRPGSASRLYHFTCFFVVAVGWQNKGNTRLLQYITVYDRGGEPSAPRMFWTTTPTILCHWQSRLGILGVVVQNSWGAGGSPPLVYEIMGLLRQSRGENEPGLNFALILDALPSRSKSLWKKHWDFQNARCCVVQRSWPFGACVEIDAGGIYFIISPSSEESAHSPWVPGVPTVASASL